jgi:UDP-N-acetylmuramate--alanine ligase
MSGASMSAPGSGGRGAGGPGMGGPVTDSGADLSRAHLVGAGGAGMSAIGAILLDRGAQVAGSDAKGSHALTGLAARGARTAIGQRAENLDLLPGGPTAVVVSSAIRPDNPEVVEARRRGLPVVRRAEALAALMSGRRAVCVAGTHGKTSTTSMLTVALQHAGLDPSFAIGGELNESGTGAHAGSGDVFVAEADESDGSFLCFSPHGAIVTTVEPDHLDHHGTAEAYAAVFEQFVGRITPGGFLVAGVDDEGVRDLLAVVRGASGGAGVPRIVGYGRSPDADVRVLDMAVHGHGGSARLELSSGEWVDLTIGVPGEHMLANAAAALAAGVELGVPPTAMAAGLAAYTGVRRRFEYKGRVGSVRVYDDYAHHPTEVAATVAAARAITEGGRLVVVFQPHLYSRTASFATQFGRALAGADLAVVLDVYGAREDPQPGVSGRLIADAVASGTARAHYLPSLARAPAELAALLRDGDVVITMGAGDVTMLGPELLDELDRRSASGPRGWQR